MEYKLLRLITFFSVSFLAIILTAICVFFIFSSTNGNILLTALIGVVAALFVAILTGFTGFQVTNQNPWVKAVQSEGMLLIGFASGGVGQIFTCTTKPNPAGGIDIVANMNKQEVTMAYDKKMTFRFLKPLNAVMELIHSKKISKDGSELGIQAETLIHVPNQDFDKYAFHFNYLTVLFYNFETQTLINKFDVNTLERFYTQKYLSLQTDRKADTYIAELRMARKNFFDALLSKLKAFLSSPVFPILIILIIGILVVVFLVMLSPQIGEFLGKVLPHSASTPASLPPAMAQNGIQKI